MNAVALSFLAQDAVDVAVVAAVVVVVGLA